MKDLKSATVRAKWMKDATCPKCHNGNAPGTSDMITIEDNGEAECHFCGHGWKPTV